jgi:lysophospholipase L1-like esterase
MDVTIPVNTTATVYVPAEDAASVLESGKPVSDAKDVKFMRMENNAAVFEVGSGSYHFCSQLAANAAADSREAADLGQPSSPTNYLAPVVQKLEQVWPKNHAVNIVFHGHSVPAGYFKTPAVDSLSAYPNLLRLALAEKFTNAVINVIVTAVGGEASDNGAARFEAEVLPHQPDVLFIDYALNDRRIGLEKAKAAWTKMIQKALATKVKVILLTPTPDQKARLDDPADPLNQHAEQIRRLAAEYHVGLVDSLARFKAALAAGTPLTNLMAQVNHPNAAGHQLVAGELVKWFPPAPSAASAPIAHWASPANSPARSATASLVKETNNHDTQGF